MHAYTSSMHAYRRVEECMHTSACMGVHAYECMQWPVAKKICEVGFNELGKMGLVLEEIT